MPYPTWWTRNNDVALVERGDWIDEHMSALLCWQVSPWHACGVQGNCMFSNALGSTQFLSLLPRYQLGKRKKKINSF